MSLPARLKTYGKASSSLACLSDARLSEWLLKAQPLHKGMGGRSALLTIDNTRLFVKKIPLTNLERQPEHFFSTANLFELPLFYQYGVGSTGFGAWRELAAHIMATNWVITQECPNFPMLYHWRILPADLMHTNPSHDLESQAAYWEHSPAIRNRLEAIGEASAELALFLEYIPHTLHQWVGTQIKEGEEAGPQAILALDKSLQEVNEFMNTQGFLHFDAHFENLLTDGKQVYFSDFGLALSTQFDLTQAERGFFNAHRSYDRCAAIVNLLHSVITSLFGKDQWDKKLQAYTQKGDMDLPPYLTALVETYILIALVMDKFYRALQKTSKLTPYPAAHLEKLLGEIDKERVVKA